MVKVGILFIVGAAVATAEDLPAVLDITDDECSKSCDCSCLDPFPWHGWGDKSPPWEPIFWQYKQDNALHCVCQTQNGNERHEGTCCPTFRCVDNQCVQGAGGVPMELCNGMCGPISGYVGYLHAYPGYVGDLKVTGDINAYLAPTGHAHLVYDLRGLEDACKTTPEGVGNACGIHIHVGKSCDDATAVGGHYYDVGGHYYVTMSMSPLGYISKYGHAHGSFKAILGKGEDIAGRAVVVHDSTGARVACELLSSKLAEMDESLMV